MSLLERLRAAPSHGPHQIRFAAPGGPLGEVWERAWAELESCVVALDGPGVLVEGGAYPGTWLESTATISAEVLGRFRPEVARETFLLLARHQRADGLLPYKVTAAGPAYRQIQLVTPLARSVFRHAALTGDDALLSTMYPALARNDEWLARHRDTRGSGGVEAFCTFDTGHDASPRFWQVSDTAYGEDPTRWDPDSPVLPFIAPDLTANVACQRSYLARIAARLGEDPAPWAALAQRSRDALFAQCFDPDDAFFYDRDANDAFVRVQSDVLLRVLACEVGDGELFATALRRYLLNSRKFFPRYPFPSIALDDPRFSQDFGRNSWAGPTNFLSLIRAPHAFEHFGHFVELTWALAPVLAAVARMDRFPQTLNPWTGEAGYTTGYSPAILWLLDAVERLCGILPQPDGSVWLTGLLPRAIDHEPVATEVAYARAGWELVNTAEGAVAYRDGVELARFPHGWRLHCSAAGEVTAVVGVSARPATGELIHNGSSQTLTVAGNEILDLTNGSRTGAGVVYPTF